MIYLELSGGLGNQLFEYAMARRVLEKRRAIYPNEKMTLLLDRYNRDARNYSLAAFMIDDCIKIIPDWKQKVASTYYKTKKHWIMRTQTSDYKLISGNNAFSLMCGRGMMCTTDTYNYYPYTVPKNRIIYIYGNFQSEKYFSDIKDILNNEFRIKQTALSIDARVLNDIQSQNSVAVHIRRGDYLSSEWGKKLNVCTEKYYIRSMEYLLENSKNPVFYIFSNTSNDLEWIKNNMNLPGNIIYVDQNGSEIEDFYLMKSCRHHIISNSTYSWWTSYLSDSPDKIVVAPSHWYKTDDQNAQDIYLDSWKLVDAD